MAAGHSIELRLAEAAYCVDNAAMIAGLGDAAFMPLESVMGWIWPRQLESPTDRLSPMETIKGPHPSTLDEVKLLKVRCRIRSDHRSGWTEPQQARYGHDDHASAHWSGRGRIREKNQAAEQKSGRVQAEDENGCRDQDPHAS